MRTTKIVNKQEKKITTVVLCLFALIVVTVLTATACTDKQIVRTNQTY